MFSAADIIEALGLRRRLKSIRPQAPGTFPPGWQTWLDTMQATPRGVSGAMPQDVIAELVLRPLSAPPTRVANLNRWQAFATLWRQQWHPPGKEERGVRLFAAVFSAAMHLFFAILLTWLAWVRIPPPPAGEGDTVVQVEFIGQGTPEDTGGGAPQGPQPEPEQTAAAPAAPAASPTPAQVEPQPQPPAPQPEQVQPEPEQPVAAQPPAEPQPPEPEPTPIEVPPAPQPLQVTQVPEPDSTFVLPPPRPREVNVPQPNLVVPELRQPTERTRVERLQRETLDAPRVDVERMRVAPVVRGEASARLTQALPTITAPTQAQEISVPTLRGEERAIPMPSRGTTPTATAPGDSTTTAPSTAPGTSTAATSAQPGGQQAPGAGTSPAAQPGAGQAPGAPPGAWPSPDRGDDFGVGTRNRPGGAPGASAKPGIFDEQGRPNIGEPPTPGQNAPGTVEARIADLDRAGQWLKRPPLDYQPTTFDKYWRPHETLLQEWVRKGIKSIAIPIPGTNKKLSCVVSILQFGGGCGLTDPDINNQPAAARPPPDIPFKPWLQEDNGSIRTPPPNASTRAQPPGL